MGKWMDLPFDLVELIEDSVVLYADKVRFRALCMFWHLQLPEIKHESPCLLQAVDDSVDASHALFNPIDKAYYFLDVPDLQGKICKGSSHGWVITIEDMRCDTNNKEHSNRIYLINPITSARIELPSRDKFPDIVKYNPHQVNEEYSVRLYDSYAEEFRMSMGKYGLYEDEFELISSLEVNELWTYKFEMSSDPSINTGEDCVIAALYGRSRTLACCTLKDKRWTRLPSGRRVDGDLFNITFCKGKLHALFQDGPGWQVVVYNNITGVKSNPHFTVIARHTVDAVTCGSNISSPYTISEDYLVESSDRSCLMVIRRSVEVTNTNVVNTEMCCTLKFKVHVVNLVNGCIVEVKGIGEDVVFLGMNTPVSISSRNLIGYKGNRIFYSDSCYIYDFGHTRQDNPEIGVFSLDDGIIQPLRDLKYSPKFLWPPPLWVDLR